MNWYAYAGNNPVVWVDPTGTVRRKAGGYVFRDIVRDPGDAVHGGNHYHVYKDGRLVGRVGVRNGVLRWVDKAGSPRVTGKLVKYAKRAGVVGGVIAAVSIGTAYAADENDPCADGHPRTARAIGAGAGGLAGAWSGAQIGGAIGAFGGPIGAAAGGLLGGIIGGVGGGAAGEEIADRVMGWF